MPRPTRRAGSAVLDVNALGRRFGYRDWTPAHKLDGFHPGPLWLENTAIDFDGQAEQYISFKEADHIQDKRLIAELSIEDNMDVNWHIDGVTLYFTDLQVLTDTDPEDILDVMKDTVLRISDGKMTKVYPLFDAFQIPFRILHAIDSDLATEKAYAELLTPGYLQFPTPIRFNSKRINQAQVVFGTTATNSQFGANFGVLAKFDGYAWEYDKVAGDLYPGSKRCADNEFLDRLKIQQQVGEARLNSIRPRFVGTRQ